MTFLQRYQNGEYEQVWKELIALGDVVSSPLYQADAIAVADETMRRVRHNVELLYKRLLGIDYRFVEPSYAFVPPPNDVEEKITKLENIIGALPLSLKSWFRHVGGVNFVGSHPSLSSYGQWGDFEPYDSDSPYYTDPLFFDDVDAAIEEIEEVKIYNDKGENFVWLKVPDWFHKADVSGGTYEFDLPSANTDTRLTNEPHETYFVDYLRQSFRWGGFLGFDLHTNVKFAAWREKWHIQSEYPNVPIPYDLLQELSKDLLPI